MSDGGAAEPASGFIEQLRAEGAARYHDRHSFHIAMHEGALTRAQLQHWVANRYYYQTRIPIKDALILAKADDPAFRRRWIRRMHEQDGAADGEGGLELWLRLAGAVGLERQRVLEHRDVVPGVRFACDAYVELVARSTLLEAVASSLTECFAPDLMSTRIAAFERHYPWVGAEAIAYFRRRVSAARCDADHGLEFVIAHASTAELQARCVRALVRKTEILWHILDSIEATCR